MIKLYKLTDKNGQTRNDTQWGPGMSHSGTGKAQLCGPGWIHAYEHPLIAVLMNPIHANFKNPQMWEAEGEVGLRDGQLKCGCKTLTTLRELPIPSITTEMRVRFAILCAKEVCASSLAWNDWADKWLSGEDRTKATATEAQATATEAASAAARAAARMAARAAEAAADADTTVTWEDTMVAWAAARMAASAADMMATRAAVADTMATRVEAKAAAAEAAAAEAAAAKAAEAAWAATWATEAGTDIFAIAEKACSGVHTFRPLHREKEMKGQNKQRLET